MIRVLVVDDHDFFRQCLVEVLNSSQDVEAVGECEDGAEVLAAVHELGPDVVLMDVHMKNLSGFGAAAAVRRNHPTTGIIMLSSDTTDRSRAAARAHGAAGYLVKGADPILVTDAIRRVAAGGTAWPETPFPRQR